MSFLLRLVMSFLGWSCRSYSDWSFPLKLTENDDVDETVI